MKRYLILTVGYQNVALPYSNGTELAALVSSISEGKQVNSVGYGDEQKYVPSADEPVQFTLVDATRVTVGDELATLKAKLEEQTRSAEQNSKYWMSANAEVAKLKKQVEELTRKPEDVAPPSDPI